MLSERTQGLLRALSNPDDALGKVIISVKRGVDVDAYVAECHAFIIDNRLYHTIVRRYGRRLLMETLHKPEAAS